ncbi:hypothetical protein HYH02_000976 [Chlamydomonas schloesseri]|uniref:cysteine dioxygenase n=1 Tax=Chlamydomonas schloesseri TaxID=2026947 RepID=A0A835WVM8_9CHLO|nr:hypothetical protein HYH02_000976 [Chlamydomonas schloesseri]|eukprot:KAG2455158.1 hypothetical protein HYH02_000976 [Chlamydomonas schloesseri]
MGRERGAQTALHELQEQPCSARRLAERNAMYGSVIKKSLLPLPCELHLVELVSDLTRAITAEKQSGQAVNYKDQDQESFIRMNSRVHALLQAYAACNAGDWRAFARWSEAGYLRHLLHECDDFELMLICWRPGQTSRVHNHADSHCWLAVLAGQVQETQYQPAGPAPCLAGTSPPELPATLLHLPDGAGSYGASSLSSSGEGNAVFAAAMRSRRQAAQGEEQRHKELGKGHGQGPEEAQAQGQGEVLCCDDLRLLRTETRCVQVGGVAYINDGLALHCVGCPAPSKPNPAAPRKATATATSSSRRSGNSGSSSSSTGGRKGGVPGGGLAALFGRRSNGSGSGAASGPDAAARTAAAADSDSATATATNGWACTLHLYAPPIRRVKAYEAGGHVTECVPGFYSRHVLRP